ncbi:MAG TPA: hypothetical protein VHA34_14315 [Actinomycetes bacterium]|nr:hypothetical protein [Actinomycetes bacterium]
MNLEELVRAALAEEAEAEPAEAGAHERFLHRRNRGALALAVSTGLGVALVLTLAIGGATALRGGDGDRDQVAGPAQPATTSTVTPTTAQASGPVETTLPAPPPVPVSADGVVRRERQGFELTLPKGWKVDQSTTRSYARFGQPWLVISPGGRVVSATDNRRMTIFTAVTLPSEYPGKPVKGKDDDLGGQSFSTLSGARSSGRRPDGRAFTVGDQGGIVGYLIAWPYRCAGGSPCPEAAPWRVLRIDVEGTGRQEGLKVRRVARDLVESIRPITNALAPTGAPVPEEPGLFADAPVVVGRGGQGDHAWEMLARKGSGQDYWIETRRQNGELFMGELFGASDRGRLVAWIHCTPSRERVTATLVSGFGPEAAARVRLELRGRPPVEVPTFRKRGFPFAFWVVAPLPPAARPLAFTAFDAAGQEIARGTQFAGYADGCP